MRKIFQALAIAAAILTVSAHAVFAETTKPVQITYWTGWSGHELDVQREIVRAFEAENPDIHVNIMTVAGSYEKVAISFAAGNPPDLMSSIWLEDLAGYAMRGVLHPLEDYARESNRDIDGEFIPAIANAMHYGKHLWGLMATTGAQFILANDASFKEAGLDPANPPKTVEAFNETNAKLAKYDASGNLVRFGMRPPDLSIWAYAYGGEWYNPETRKVTANLPANVRALEDIAAYGKKYDGRKLIAFENLMSGAQMGYVSDTGNFAGLFNGYSAMLFTGGYAQEFITRFAPASFRCSFFPLPAPAGGRPGAFVLSGSVFVIPRDAKHPREAWRFLNYLISPPQVKTFCVKIGNMPPLKALLKDPEFNKTAMERFSRELLEKGHPFAPAGMPIWAYYLNELGRAQQAAFLGGEDPKKLLDDVQVKVQAALDKALKYAVY